MGFDLAPPLGPLHHPATFIQNIIAMFNYTSLIHQLTYMFSLVVYFHWATQACTYLYFIYKLLKAC